MRIRQPIVSVLGHVDHGKTTLLDMIRGSTVASREAGRITQHIGATEVPIEAVIEICGDMLQKTALKVPGLLFIDTPGHHSFTTLRARGGALADLAVLMIDIREGIKPQTEESIGILKRYKTPFVIAANKIDRIPGWQSKKKRNFNQAFQSQPEFVKANLDDMIYKLIGRFHNLGFSTERFDRIEDFQKNVAIVPISASFGEGISELLMILIGLAQRYLEKVLKTEEGPAEGTVLEVKEERGLGTTIDVIIYKGTLKKGDTVVIGTTKEPIVTKVKALLRPKPLDEIRDPREQFGSSEEVSAASGVKVLAQNLESVLAGAQIRVTRKDLENVIAQIKADSKLDVETADEGIIVKADAVGSLEAIIYELKEADIPIKSAEIGDVSRRDVVEASTLSSPLFKVIFAFNVNVLPNAKEELVSSQATILENSVIYQLMEDYKAWAEIKKGELEKEARMSITHPGSFKILPDYVFRVSKPAIVGVRVLVGRIRPGQSVLKPDGRVIGKIKSVQQEGKGLKEAISGEEVAVSIEGVTVGRQFDVEDILYIDIPESHAKLLNAAELSVDEQELLKKVFDIKRKEEPFWGM